MSETCYLVTIFDGRKERVMVGADRFGAVHALETMGEFDEAGLEAVRDFLEERREHVLVSTPRFDLFGTTFRVAMYR